MATDFIVLREATPATRTKAAVIKLEVVKEAWVGGHRLRSSSGWGRWGLRHSGRGGLR